MSKTMGHTDLEEHLLGSPHHKIVSFCVALVWFWRNALVPWAIGSVKSLIMVDLFHERTEIGLLCGMLRACGLLETASNIKGIAFSSMAGKVGKQAGIDESCGDSYVGPFVFLFFF